MASRPNMIDDCQMYIEWEHWYSNISVYAKIKGQSCYAKPVEFEWKDIEPGEATDHEPMMQLSKYNAQLLMDGLWQCGIRPTEQVGSVGQLKATQDHLEDMRRLVFKGDE